MNARTMLGSEESERKEEIFLLLHGKKKSAEDGTKKGNGGEERRNFGGGRERRRRIDYIEVEIKSLKNVTDGKKKTEVVLGSFVEEGGITATVRGRKKGEG